ncbi:hypothetical protein INT45_014028 [Circinella minor]|uniref:F-box domain-containing protein n=1 Tax=Circinella minor TaxID=1195481 RepID=A0A8H7S276_9FUNG|nr:hypothetical protein INT45_014028 [Circinella minor]
MDMMKLPFELAEIVFSQLNECDIIQCMCVCKHWFNQVPYYSHKVFERLEITPNSSKWKYTKKYLLCCVGSHVTSLNILEDGNDVHQILKEFRNSNLTSLGIEYYRPPLIDCTHDETGTIVDEYKTTSAESATLLFTELRNFYSESLTKLSITHHFRCTITLLDVMENFPQLTHLTLSTSLDLDEENVNNNNNNIDFIDKTEINSKLQQPKKSSTSIYSSLIYLNIDHSFDFDLTVIPFIKHCPNLSHICFTTLNDNNFKYIYKKDGNRVSHLLDAAPNLYSFISSELCCRASEKYQSSTHSTIDDFGQSRLQSLSSLSQLESGVNNNKDDNQSLNVFILDQTDGQYVDGSLSVILKRSQQTLRILDVSLEMFTFYRISTHNVTLFNVHLPRLAVLRLSCLDIDPDWIATLLRQSPILEEIELNEVPDHLTQEIVDAISILQFLRRFIFSVYLSGITADPPTQQIDLKKWAAQTSRLQEINLYNVYPTDHMLYYIGQIPSLKKFCTNHRDGYNLNGPINLVTTYGLFAFAAELAKNKSNGSSHNTSSMSDGLQELQLKGFNTLTDTVLEAFGDVDSLTNLQISKCTITDDGLKAFVNKKAMTLKKLSLTYCKNISEDSINYAKLVFGASNVSFIQWRRS